MLKKDILKLFDVATKAKYCLRLKLNSGKSIILLPAMGPIETVEIEGEDFLKLKKSLLPVSNIAEAIIYGDDPNAE